MRLFWQISLRLMQLCMMLAAMLLSAQNDYTKSGTRVTPIAYERAQKEATAKSAKSPLPDPTAGTYLIVTRPGWEPQLEPFIIWKRQQGFRVEVMEMGTKNRDSIRAALMERYLSSTALHPAQRYVLLVGDVDRLQACNGKYTPSGLSQHATDLYYGEYTNDYIPEAYVGRLSVADSSQLAVVTDKIIRYEKGFYSGAHQLLIAAGNESRANAPTTTNGQVNYLSEQFARFRPSLDTICFRNPQPEGTLDSVLGALSAPNALVNYTAHCNNNGWNNPVVTAAMIDSLHNTTPTVYVNNCCRSNAFNSDCFGEQLLRQPQGGAAGVIGATNESFWDEDFYYAVGAKYPVVLNPQYDSTRPGAFDPLWEPACYDADQMSLGALNYAGCWAVTQSGSPYDAFYWEIYCLLGDPSMVPYMGQGDTLFVTLPDTIFAGISELEVQGSAHARITLTQGDRMLGTTLLNNLGRGVVILTEGLAGDSLHITATRSGALAWEADMEVTTPTRGRLAIRDIQLDSTGQALLLRVSNVGSAPVRSHFVVLSQSERDRAEGIALPNRIYSEVTLESQQSDTTLRYSIAGYKIGQEPILLAHIDLGADSDIYCTHQVAIEMPDRRPQLSLFAITDNTGENVKQFIPGESYSVTAIYTHIADSVAWGADGFTTETEYDADTCHFVLEWPVDEDHLQIASTAHKDFWSTRYGGWLIAHRATEDFETENGYGWQMDADHPWQWDLTTAHGGQQSMKSAPIGNAQRSAMALDLETLTDDTLSFYLKVSAQEGDWLNFYIDGQRRGYWTGNAEWQRYSRLLKKGKHLLVWVYQKDAAGQERDDCAWIDDVRFPAALWPTRCGKGIADSIPVQRLNVPGGDNTPFAIYPNPASDKISINTAPMSTNRWITVYNSLGQEVDNIFIPANNEITQYSTAHLRFGIYTFALKSSLEIHTCKLIIR